MSTSERDVLLREEALLRSSRVRDVRYQLELRLQAGETTYAGRTEIEFDLVEPEVGSFIDFSGHVTSVAVNGRAVEVEHRAHRLWLDAAVLGPHNRVTIEYRNSFDATGDGFHHFVDPEDGAEYTYTNLEPFSAHRLFPCFDQPDIKATYRLDVWAPADWRVISAEATAERTTLPDGRHLHRFKPTPRFSTYLFSLIAGPYERVGSIHDGIPLGLYGRRSMRRELDRAATELFEVTAQGLDYYRELFGQPYPFAKYDQLFVPEFNAGAMENVGAVTYHDSFIFREAPTYGQRLLRGEVVLHELAHMWFGDLVTMRWWDDLWLNETFATYLSYRCLADATEFGDAWQVFNGQMRPAALRQDQLITTHAVATAVEHTDQAIGNFDAITYEKGAAVIRQLVAALGDDAFRSGLHTYFERHAWSNATLADFLGALGDAAGRSLDDWSRVWLQTPSLNTLAVDWGAADGRIEWMELRQDAPKGYPTLRPHATNIGLVTEDAAAGELRIHSLAARIEGPFEPIPAAVGLPVPALVYPNHGDHDYALPRLDEVSLQFALTRLPQLPDALLRQQVWSALWEMVRDARLRSLDFLGAVRRFAPTETDRALTQAILDRAASTIVRFVPAEVVDREAAALHGTALDVMRSTPHEDVRLVWARTAAAIAAEPRDVATLLGLVDGEWSIDGFQPDQQMRWDLAVKAVAHGLDGAEDRLEAEGTRDRSDRGQRTLIRAQASRPDEASKAAAWERINGRGFGSDYLTRSAIAGFQWRHQREALLPFRDPFFERIEAVYASRDHAFAQSYVGWLTPDLWAEPEVLVAIEAATAGLAESSLLLRRQLSEIGDDLSRAIGVRAFAARGVTA